MAEDLSVEELFDKAKHLTGAERQSLLNSLRNSDPSKFERVERLLSASELAGSFLEHPAMAETEVSTNASLPESIIGPYKLLEQIGEGGMGTVFMAEQTHPVVRRVAVKIIKPGMDSRSVIARFEAERQALAIMDHPNIAKVLDAGTTENGHPYFVMELVKGVPITDFCDENKLPIRERLELLIQVCKAVQHAHQKGIIHRDLKPSNVLVAKYDDQPVPKVIDFGVAKAISQKLTEKTMFTQFGQIVGTLEYMSPEQAQFNQLDVDTRSDIFSLGVLLYELLTSETPFSREKLRSTALEEVLRIIREDEPPRPSNRVSSLGQKATLASSNRNLEIRKFGSYLKGDLDWIAMKAMEKDRRRRYESAAAMAADLDNYLNDGVIVARSPSLSYRARKYVLRNKGAVAAVSTIFAALLIGLVATLLTLSQLNSTVAELHNLIIEKALLQAVDGDFEGLHRTIELGKQANLPSDWLLTMEGFGELQNGDNQKARGFFDKAIEYDGSNVSARALQSWALFQSGDLESWSHHVQQTQANAVPREEWAEFDEFFLGFTDFYGDYAEARKRFDRTVKSHPTWMFARLMSSQALAHEAWAGNPDAEKANQAVDEMEAISEYLPDTNFVVATRLFIYMSVLYSDSEVDVAEIRSKADPLAQQLDGRMDYQIGNWCLLKYYELVNDPEGQSRARQAAYKHNQGFMFLSAFEEMFINGEYKRILEVSGRGDEVLLMQALVHAWNGNNAEALRLADLVEARNTSWVMRQRVIWVYLVCKELRKARELSENWLKEGSESGGRVREMNFDREAIRIVAEGSTGADIETASLTLQSRLHLEFISGLIALSQSERRTALDHFKAAVATNDDWEVTRYANALAVRLENELMKQ